MSIKVILYFFSAVLVLLILLSSFGGSIQPRETYIDDAEEEKEGYEEDDPEKEGYEEEKKEKKDNEPDNIISGIAQNAMPPENAAAMGIEYFNNDGNNFEMFGNPDKKEPVSASSVPVGFSF